MITFRQPFRNEWPITQRYGEKATSSFHTGIDYGCPPGTEIFASADGTVMFTGWEANGYGNYLIIRHTEERSTLYAHLKDIQVSKGSKVRQGDVIAHSGSTGNSTGPHLHFEARKSWSDYRSHFDPFSLPLMSVYDDAKPSADQPVPALTGAETFEAGDIVKIACPDGAWTHSADFSSKTARPEGTLYEFVGKTVERNGLTYCKCRPITNTSVWIAVNDGTTQILKKL